MTTFVVEKRKEHVKRKSNDYEKGIEHHRAQRWYFYTEPPHIRADARYTERPQPKSHQPRKHQEGDAGRGARTHPEDCVHSSVLR